MGERFFSGDQFIFDQLHEEIARQRFQEEYAGYRVTDGFYVLPALAGRLAPAEFRHVIHLDGYSAFGDGRHATTRMCLYMLESYLVSMGAAARDGLRFLDAGTGTGILSIGAAMLGVADIEAFDIDERSVESARYNATLNGCGRIRFAQSDIAGYEGGGYDLVMANLLSDVIEANVGPLAGFVAPGGVMIASGISDMRRGGVVSLLEGHGLRRRHHMSEEGWNSYFLAREG
ncbi:MAG: 50S ribosomal protein L11 methyltransferase [Spirochaetes bacterium]|nr:50S ribosomal protein L11 methyltransferase [Spirochaetota bacterium]